MEVRNLSVVVEQSRLNDVLPRFVPADAGVSDLAVAFRQGRVCVTGKVKKMLASIGFEAVCDLAVVAGKVRLRLETVKGAMGIGNFFRGKILKMLTEKLAEEPWFEQQGDVLWFDVDRMLAARGIPLRVSLQRIACMEGELHIEGGTRTSADET